ncbi:MAG TPA: hypothetical protein VFO06_06135 [Gemmatimonadales bacterium]|nr:hypothetical protein [Gemmatimonadales bacterium]
MRVPIHPLDRSGRSQPALLAGYAALFLIAGLAWRLTDRLDAATRPWAEIGRSAAHLPAQPSILFLFRVSDCALALRDIERWNALNQQGGVRVRGVVLDPPAGLSLDDVARLERIGFPLRHARPRDVLPRLQALGVPRTPVSLLLDRQGRVRLVLPAVRQLDGFGLVDSLLVGL